MNAVTLRVVHYVADRFGLAPDVVLSRCRSKSIVLARMVCIYVVREYGRPRMSFPELGREFDLDHTTVISACRTVAKRTESDTWVRDVVCCAAGTVDRLGGVGGGVSEDQGMAKRESGDSVSVERPPGG